MMELVFPHDLPRTLGKFEFMVFFLLACAEQQGIAPVTHKWIMEHMPYATSPNTVTAALRFLCSPEKQIAVKAKGGWRLATAVQLPLAYPELPDAFASDEVRYGQKSRRE